MWDGNTGRRLVPSPSDGLSENQCGMETWRGIVGAKYGMS